jgi:hypothetical protein
VLLLLLLLLLLFQEETKFTFLKIRRQCPLVLLVKAGRQQGKALSCEEGIVKGGGLLGEWSWGNELRVRAEFGVRMPAL